MAGGREPPAVWLCLHCPHYLRNTNNDDAADDDAADDAANYADDNAGDDVRLQQEVKALRAPRLL